MTTPGGKTKGAGRWLEKLPLFRKQPLYAFAAMLAICAVALVLRLAVDPLIPPGFPFLTFFPAVFAAGLLFGGRVGVFAGVLCALLTRHFFLPRLETYALAPGAQSATTLFLIVTAAMMLLVYWMHRSTARLVRERERSAQLAQTRALLFRELQHRVSNNLQVAGALLMLQRSAVSEPAARHALDEAAMRLTVIGGISRQLYDIEGRPRPLHALLDPLCADVVRASGRSDIAIAVHAAEGLAVPPQAALPLGLIVAESVANAIEHGFAARGGAIAVAAACREDGALVVEVADDGAGLRAGFSVAEHGGLGLRIATMLAKQLGGSFELVAATGTTAQLVVPAGCEGAGDDAEV
jgi:two-component sensor histidine kinase